MSTYDESLLAARFAVLAPEPLAGDWDDVLRRAGATRENRLPLERSRGRERHLRRFLVVLAAAIVVVVVGTAAAYGIRVYFLDKGFIGLPPLGATPSSPETGELVLAAYGIADAGRAKVWVYADGRLLTQSALMGGEPTPGFLEQRLTSEGVELLRSEIVSTGLFDDDKELKFESRNQPCANFIRVRDAGSLVVVTWHGAQCLGLEGRLATAGQAKSLEQLVERLIDLESWLPASAWEDRETKAYVPSRFAVCYGTAPPTPATEPSRILSLLPKAAADMLEGKGSAPRHGFLVTGGSIRPIVADFCSDLTTDEARTLAQVLHESPAHEGVQIYVEPYLPHGEFICSACG